MRIAILTPSITSGDAVSNDVLGMYQALRELGDVRVFAEGWTLREPRILPVRKIKSFLKNSADILIYHYSRGWEPGIELLSQLRCRKVVKYHNVTPPEFAVPFNREYADMCEAGRRQIRPVARSNCDLFLAASVYNLRELIHEGADQSRSFVVHPFHHVDRLTSIEADATVLKQFQNGHVNICTVGRVAPNKGHPELIAAFAAYHHDYNPQSRLLIVGREEARLAKYSKLLRELVTRFRLKDAVIFAGHVSDHELKAYYHVADVFVTTSEHEGFCVPLVEAMAMKVPILAYASSAIPETVGTAGIVWDQRNPYLLAESIKEIAGDPSLRRSLTSMGWRRYQELFTNDRIRRELIDTLAPLF
jgi:glycosyltransferase involved in cell wall biosynthesis